MKTLLPCFILLIVFVPMIHAQDTIKVRSGWNMIGALSTKALTQISTDPPGIIISYYFGYSPSGYILMDTLNKGEGYWVRASQAGLLFVNQPPATPSSPTPANNAKDISISLTLSWTCTDPENDPLTYDVYFGMDNPPSTKVSSEQSDTSLSQSGLDSSTIYYWKIVAKDNHGNTTIGWVWSFTTTVPPETSCPATVFYSGKIYNTVQIGTQCWFKENLNIGTMVDSLQNQTNNSTIEKYCYNNDTTNCNTYGGLYQWDEVMQYSTTQGTQGICPTGWHIPTLDELQTLSTIVGGNGNALKAIGQGFGGGAGTNTSGFSALLSGFRHLIGYFGFLGRYTYFWSSTVDNAPGTSTLGLYNDGSGVYFYSLYVESGLCVRCLKD